MLESAELIWDFVQQSNQPAFIEFVRASKTFEPLFSQQHFAPVEHQVAVDFRNIDYNFLMVMAVQLSPINLIRLLINLHENAGTNRNKQTLIEAGF